jgi:uncharacterized protein
VSLDYLTAAPGPAPVVHPGNAPWWHALAAGELRLPRCTGCGTVRFPPAEACWRCLSFGYELAVVTTTGTVETSVVVERVTGRSRWQADVPYRTGLIALGGFRLPGRIVCSCGAAGTPGTPVTAGLLATVDGPPVLGFAHACPG